jgi:hypothetical protein
VPSLIATRRDEAEIDALRDEIAVMIRDLTDPSYPEAAATEFA